MVVWSINKFRGQTQLDLKTKIVLDEEVSMFLVKKTLGPVKMNFEINQKKNAPL